MARRTTQTNIVKELSCVDKAGVTRRAIYCKQYIAKYCWQLLTMYCQTIAQQYMVVIIWRHNRILAFLLAETLSHRVLQPTYQTGLIFLFKILLQCRNIWCCDNIVSNLLWALVYTANDIVNNFYNILFVIYCSRLTEPYLISWHSMHPKH